jgi:hypothetical protein
MRKILFGTTALLLALAALGVAAPQRAVAQKGPPVSAQVNIDLNKTVDDISKTIGAAKDRGAWVRGMGEQLRAKYGAKYNVMVFNMQQGFDFNPGPPGTYKFIQKTFDGGLTGKIQYGIWIFRSAAVFKNKGDGGYINWAFSGAYNRNGGTVTFAAR